MPKSSREKNAKRGRSEPTGDEIMKRRVPSDWSLRPKRFEFDPKKAYSPEQLAEMAAISIKWNQIESQVDFICSHILFTKVPFWLQISVDGVLNTSEKLRLLEECSERAELLGHDAKQCITDAFFHFKLYRGYRNAIVHHSIYDHEKGIGAFINEAKKPYQIMVSPDALRNFYNIICVLQKELWDVDLLFRIETDAQRPVTINRRTGRTTPYPPTRLREQVIPDLTKKVLALQKERKSLPPLPKFPDADLIRLSSEERARHPDPEEMDQASHEEPLD